MKRIFLFMFFLILVSESLFSQVRNPVTLSAEVIPGEIEKGGKGELIVTCSIEEGFHISDTSGIFNITTEHVQGIVFEEPKFPPAEKETYQSVYRGTIEVTLPFSVSNYATDGEITLSVLVKTLPCEEETGMCGFPMEQSVTASFRVSREKEGGVSLSESSEDNLEDAEVQVGENDLSEQENNQTGTDEEEGLAGRLSRALKRGSLAAFLIVFLGGLLTSFTPCVYPMIPITMSVIGAQATGSKLRGFVLSLFYVLGISFTFSTLGVIAVKTGSLFGSFGEHPVTKVFIATIFFLMGLSMLGVFVLQMPSWLASKLKGKKRSGFLGTFITGLVAGLIVSPCISPLLVVILAFVAQTGSVLMGISLLFTFALGLGVLFIAIGTFSGVIKNLPKSGGWMVTIEHGFGVLLVMLSIIFIRPILSSLLYIGLWAVFLVILGTFMGAFTPIEGDAGSKRKIGKALGILAVIVGGCLIFFSIAERAGIGTKMEVESSKSGFWILSEEEGLQQAKTTGNPILLDFYSENCEACRELDEKTWPDASVQDELLRFVPVKLDLTRNDQTTAALTKKYGLYGLPTVVILDHSEKELYRFTGFKDPQEVIKILKKF